MRIFFTVTNDLSYDQRMIRICTSLVNAGHQVTLVGREFKNSIKLIIQPFSQKRLRCIFNKGPLFYSEYNTRLFFFLLSQKMDAICAIDLDTILPCYYISKKKKIPRVYDAHELFCEMKEIVDRPKIYRLWKKIEQFAVPKFKLGYTVNKPIADEFKKMYGVNYSIIRSIALLKDVMQKEQVEPYIIYQGAVNEGRSFETLIPAMKNVSIPLYIFGDGNFLEQAKKLVSQNKLEKKVLFKGKFAPSELQDFTANAMIGVTLFDDRGLSNYYSLANRFFDYIHAGVPQLCVDYPVYREINNTYNVALLTNDISSETLAEKLNLLIQDKIIYERLKENCMKARTQLNWQEEENVLLSFYQNIDSANTIDIKK